MCVSVFIGSMNELPVIPWIEDQPGLHIAKEPNTKTLDFITNILESDFIYSAGSHMGCACGLIYGEWSKNSQNENHSARVTDVKNFMNYLKQNKVDNDLKLFCTWWEEFPKEYKSYIFDLNTMNGDEFEFIEDVILIVK